jgi:acyl-CoA thioesterase FadM
MRPSTGGWEELVSAAIHIVCVNSKLMKATSIPTLLRSKLEALQ